jgi:hypothetical protein
MVRYNQDQLHHQHKQLKIQMLIQDKPRHVRCFSQQDQQTHRLNDRRMVIRRILKITIAVHQAVRAIVINRAKDNNRGIQVAIMIIQEVREAVVHGMVEVAVELKVQADIADQVAAVVMVVEQEVQEVLVTEVVVAMAAAEEVSVADQEVPAVEVVMAVVQEAAAAVEVDIVDKRCSSKSDLLTLSILEKQSGLTIKVKKEQPFKEVITFVL